MQINREIRELLESLEYLFLVQIHEVLLQFQSGGYQDLEDSLVLD